MKHINEEKKEMEGKNISNLEEQAISLVGRTIYEKLIKGYTEKQWNRNCKELPAFIIKRLPVRLIYDNNYFNDKYQGIPIGGYTKLVEKMLEGIEVRLNTNYFDNRKEWNEIAEKVIYTGMLDEYFEYKLGRLEYRSLKFDTKIIVNACGNTVEDYVELCRVLNSLNIDAVELNLSCPNVKQGCLAFGTTYEGVKNVTSQCRKVLDKPLIVKLTPNVTDITETAKAVEDAGADGVSLINTLLGMSIDIEKQRPFLANNTGGLSGPAIKPVAVRMVYQVAQKVNIPVLGLGGIVNGNDAVEFMLAGAKAISIGCGNFIDPYAGPKTVEGIEDYLKRHNIDDVNDIVGKVKMN